MSHWGFTEAKQDELCHPSYALCKREKMLPGKFNITNWNMSLKTFLFCFMKIYCCTLQFSINFRTILKFDFFIIPLTFFSDFGHFLNPVMRVHWGIVPVWHDWGSVSVSAGNEPVVERMGSVVNQIPSITIIWFFLRVGHCGSNDTSQKSLKN